MSFIYKRVIRVQDTDATGVLYFANQLQIGLEAFEEFMRQSGFSFAEMIAKKQFLLPIVHAEADFFSPITVGEQIEVILEISRVGTSSFTHFSEFKRGNKRVGTVTIIHAFYSPKKKKAEPISDALKNFLLT